MGAIVDRLVITTIEARAWLKLPLTFLQVVLKVWDTPPANVNVGVQLNGLWFTVNSGATPTKENIAAALVTALNAATSLYFEATDNLDGTFVVSTKVENQTFLLYLQGPIEMQDISPEEVQLSSLILASKQLADEYCNNPFTDSAGEPLPIPEIVKVGVLQLLGWMWNESKLNAIGMITGPVKSQRAGDLAVSYATPAEVGVGSTSITSMQLPNLVKSMLDAFRLIPGGGPGGLKIR